MVFVRARERRSDNIAANLFRTATRHLSERAGREDRATQIWEGPASPGEVMQRTAAAIDIVPGCGVASSRRKARDAPATAGDGITSPRRIDARWMPPMAFAARRRARDEPGELQLVKGRGAVRGKRPRARHGGHPGGRSSLRAREITSVKAVTPGSPSAIRRTFCPAAIVSGPNTGPLVHVLPQRVAFSTPPTGNGSLAAVPPVDELLRRRLWNGAGAQVTGVRSPCASCARFFLMVPPPSRRPISRGSPAEGLAPRARSPLDSRVSWAQAGAPW